MATVTDTELTGRALRVLRSIDAAGNTSWYKLSLWSHAVDTYFTDGKTAQAKLGGINGITSDVNGTATDIAASIKTVRDVSIVANTANSTANAADTRSTTNANNLGNCRFSYENGKYYIQAGADTGTKKQLGSGLDGARRIVWVKNTNIRTPTVTRTENRYEYECKQMDAVDVCTVTVRNYDHLLSPADPDEHNYTTILHVSIKDIFPDIYTDLTEKNFFFCPSGYTFDKWEDSETNIAAAPDYDVTITYDPSIGKLTIDSVQSITHESWEHGGVNGGGRFYALLNGYEIIIIT